MQEGYASRDVFSKSRVGVDLVVNFDVILFLPASPKSP
jgi:hypothetical protein